MLSTIALENQKSGMWPVSASKRFVTGSKNAQIRQNWLSSRQNNKKAFNYYRILLNYQIWHIVMFSFPHEEKRCFSNSTNDLAVYNEIIIEFSQNCTTWVYKNENNLVIVYCPFFIFSSSFFCKQGTHTFFNEIEYLEIFKKFICNLFFS